MTHAIPFTRRRLNRKPCAEEAGLEIRDPVRAGSWICKLETVTPLIINSLFPRLSAAPLPPFIQGSSLRGMVRNAAEMLGAGCCRYCDVRREDLDPDYRGLSTCREQSACVVCRIFGFVDRQTTWTSKVAFADALSAQTQWTQVHIPGRTPHLQSPGLEWAFFAHGDSVPAEGPLRAAATGVFTFTVDYINLDDEQRDILRFALTLRHDQAHLCHRLGFAKALGYGACRISIDGDPAPLSVRALSRQFDSNALNSFLELRR